MPKTNRMAMHHGGDSSPFARNSSASGEVSPSGMPAESIETEVRGVTKEEGRLAESIQPMLRAERHRRDPGWGGKDARTPPPSAPPHFLDLASLDARRDISRSHGWTLRGASGLSCAS